VQTAIAALGNPALSRALPLERHLRDVLLARVHPPQLDLARVAVGRRELDRLRPVALLGKDLS
jgi:alkylation response protein AidB-like acyl-CoA dehydrogenase